MTSAGRGWLAERFGALSTGLKMLLILSLALLPLGFIAILASIQNARDNNAKRASDARAQLEFRAQRINSAVSRGALTVRAASAAVLLAPAESQVCAITLERLADEDPARGRYALYGPGGKIRCATPGYAPALLPFLARQATPVALSPQNGALLFTVYDHHGHIEGAGEFSLDGLRRLILPAASDEAMDLAIVQGDRRLVLEQGYRSRALAEPVEAAAPVGSTGLQLVMRVGAVPVSAAELLMILLPIMMWLAAAGIGWLIVDRLLLTPLRRIQQAVSAYRPGQPSFDMPALPTPAREIHELGVAFDSVTRTVAHHEMELQAAVERQRKLVREVHHRVKNNLQVVASLLNLHSRGSATEEVAAAYASIQRRVDALAVVHRNHYAEMEENRGVALRPLVSELAANLRASAPASAAAMAIRLDLDPFHATQDVAVSIAFLITEIVEFAMFCGATAVSVSLLQREGETGVAKLVVESESLAADAACDPTIRDRFNRVVTGLSRQLRSSMDRDEALGRYALDIAVLPS